jgi:hypothetical protein
MSASPSPGRHRLPDTVTTRPGVDTAAGKRAPEAGAPSSPGRHRLPDTVTTRPGVDTAAGKRAPAAGAPSSPEGRCLSDPGEPADRRVTGLRGQAGDAAAAAVEAQPPVAHPALPRSRRRSLWLS